MKKVITYFQKVVLEKTGNSNSDVGNFVVGQSDQSRKAFGGKERARESVLFNKPLTLLDKPGRRQKARKMEAVLAHTMIMKGTHHM